MPDNKVTKKKPGLFANIGKFVSGVGKVGEDVTDYLFGTLDSRRSNDLSKIIAMAGMTKPGTPERQGFINEIIAHPALPESLRNRFVRIYGMEGVTGADGSQQPATVAERVEGVLGTKLDSNKPSVWNWDIGDTNRAFQRARAGSYEALADQRMRPNQLKPSDYEALLDIEYELNPTDSNGKKLDTTSISDSKLRILQEQANQYGYEIVREEIEPAQPARERKLGDDIAWWGKTKAKPAKYRYKLVPAATQQPTQPIVEPDKVKTQPKVTSSTDTEKEPAKSKQEQKPVIWTIDTVADPVTGKTNKNVRTGDKFVKDGVTYTYEGEGKWSYEE